MTSIVQIFLNFYLIYYTAKIKEFFLLDNSIDYNKIHREIIILKVERIEICPVDSVHLNLNKF